MVQREREPGRNKAVCLPITEFKTAEVVRGTGGRMLWDPPHALLSEAHSSLLRPLGLSPLIQVSRKRSSGSSSLSVLYQYTPTGLQLHKVMFINNKLWTKKYLWCLFFLINLFIYFWLFWVFFAAHGLSLVVLSGGYSSLWCAGFSLRWLLLLPSTGSTRAGFSSCGTWALECRLSSCGARA